MNGPKQLALPSPALSPLETVGRALRALIAPRSARRLKTPPLEAVTIDPISDGAVIRRALSTRLPPHLLKDIGGGGG